MFKYFNPIWIIKNFLQPSLGPEVLIPAAIGAVGSAAMGKSPVTGALLGGATGGLLGGAGGNLFSGFKSALPSAAPSLGSGGYAALGQAGGAGIGGASTGITINPILNSVDDVMPIDKITSSYIDDMASQGFSGTTFPANNQIAFKDFYAPANLADDSLSFGAPLSSSNQMFTNNLTSQFASTPNPLTIDPRRMVVDTPLTLGERISDFGSNIIPNTASYIQQNPMVALGGGQSLLNIRQQNQMIDQQKLRDAMAKAPPIRQGQTGPMAGNLLQVRRIG